MPDPALIVAISRQRGSGGSEIGQRIADRLKLRYVDRQMLRHAAEFLRAQDEQAGTAPAAGSWWSRLGEAMGVASSGFGHVPLPLDSCHEAELRGVEERLLKEIAEYGRAVIVGCGAAQMFKGRPRVFSVFLHAPAEWRIARLCHVYGLERRAAEEAIRDADRSRARFVELLTGAPWFQSASYDLALDTSSTGIDSAVAVIADAAERCHPA